MSFLTGSDDEFEFVEPQTSIDARKRIEAIAQTSAEGIPLREIAPLSELEQQAFTLVREFLQDDTGEITIDKAIDVAVQIAEQRIDLNTPEIQGIIREVRRTGDLELNRIGRSLQKTGAISTTAGRDILGRKISETEQATAAALSPLLESFRTRRLQAASLLPGLIGARTAQTTGRIATGAAAGEVTRSLQQRINDALQTRGLSMFEFETTGKAALNALLLQDPTGRTKLGGPSELQKGVSIGGDITAALSLLGPVISGFKGLTGGTKTTGIPGLTASGAPKTTQLA